MVWFFKIKTVSLRDVHYVNRIKEIQIWRNIVLLYRVHHYYSAMCLCMIGCQQLNIADNNFNVMSMRITVQNMFKFETCCNSCVGICNAILYKLLVFSSLIIVTILM